MTKDAIARRAKAEHWEKDRATVRDISATQSIQKAADAISDNAAKQEKARNLAIDVILTNLAKLKEMQGSRITTRTEDKHGNPVTVDFSLNDMVTALEKLQRMNFTGADLSPVTIVWERTK